MNSRVWTRIDLPSHWAEDSGSVNLRGLGKGGLAWSCHCGHFGTAHNAQRQDETPSNPPRAIQTAAYLLSISPKKGCINEDLPTTEQSYCGSYKSYSRFALARPASTLDIHDQLVSYVVPTQLARCPSVHLSWFFTTGASVSVPVTSRSEPGASYNFVQFAHAKDSLPLESRRPIPSN